MYSHTILDAVFLASVAVIWFMVGYQALLFFLGHQFYQRTRRSGKFVASIPDAELPAVSVLVPCHNEELVISGTLRALFALKYPAALMEVLVVDDGSTDRTAEIVQQFVRDPRLTLLRVPAEIAARGKAGALNYALTAAKHPIVAIYDADNRPEPWALRPLVEALVRDPTLGAAIGVFRCLNRRRNLLTRFLNIEGIAFQWIVQAGRWALMRFTALPGTNYVIRRSLLQSLGGWDPSALTEDAELTLRIYEAGYSIAFVPTSVTWEQEPENLRTWLRQRHRWVRGNNHVFKKHASKLLRIRPRSIGWELLYSLSLFYGFFLAVVTSDLFFILGAVGLVRLEIAGPYTLVWLFALLAFCLQLAIALAYENEGNSWSDHLLILAMYFTYCQLWIPVVAWAFFDDFIIRRPAKWAKTRRFAVADQELTPGPSGRAGEIQSLPERESQVAPNYRRRISCFLLLASGIGLGWPQETCNAATPERPTTGYVLHFDAISNVAEGRHLVTVGVEAGAKVISVVPPAHVWGNQRAMEMLNAVVNQIVRQKLSLIFARIDASYPPDAHGQRFNYLYHHILTTRGVLPNGIPTTEQFLSTVGRKDYENWMEQEIRFYAKHYGKLPNLLGINVGPFSEPFTAQRCGFLMYVDDSSHYEVTQYTPYATELWHYWLREHFRNIRTANQEYGASFASWDKIPLPRNESDNRFGKPQRAFFDFVRALNDWFVERYERCRRIWHEASGRSDVPLILQFNGFELEKLVNGRPSYTAFDLPGWVARADAVGLSVYTNSGYDDFGHSSVKATVNFLALAKELGKDVFVLESGCEAPNVVLDPRELEFLGTVALKLHPRTFIYEWLKDEFNEEYPSNPGKLVTAQGEIRHPALQALQDLFRRIESTDVDLEPPALYAVFDPMAARENLHAGEVALALYDLAEDLPIRWIPKGIRMPMQSGVPVINPDGEVSPEKEHLSMLLRSIPLVDTRERERWREEFVGLFQSGATQ